MRFDGGTTEYTGWNNDYFHVMMNGLDELNIYDIILPRTF